MKKALVLFGLGRIGRKILDEWQRVFILPDYLSDNNSSLWGQKQYDVPVVPPECISSIHNPLILIAIKEGNKVYRQLLEMGIPQEEIVYKKGNAMYILGEICLRCDLNNRLEAYASEYGRINEKKVIFELQNGLTLGGVESWAVQSADILKKLSLQSDVYSETGDASKPLDYYLAERPGTIICNFTGTNTISACIYKKIYKSHVMVVAVLHNDEEEYYSLYSLMEPLIDAFCVISSSSRRKLMSRKVGPEKIRMLEWNVEVPARIEHNYSGAGSPIRIGYAGRVTVRQKRTDLIREIIDKLDEAKTEYMVEIAGDGEDVETFKEYIKGKSNPQNIRLLGRISRDDIPAFWQRQDIAVSCSDWEGRSISQQEAMASGAVPVVTDVSGARDDITDGENGFIVDVGDVGRMVERIIYLSEHRDVLENMGRKAYESMKAQKEKWDEVAFWKELLGSPKGTV